MKTGLELAAANGGKVRVSVTRHFKMLHVARMAGLAKLRCGIVTDCGGRLWAVHVGQALANLRGCAAVRKAAVRPELPVLRFALMAAFGT